MDIALTPVAFSDIREEVRAHLALLPFPIDSFLEDHILASTHYRILLGGQEAGYASIHSGRLITQFTMREEFRARGQSAFARLKRTEQVQSAFVPTCDPFYLAHALDAYRQLALQAYFFVTGPRPFPCPPEYQLRPATPADIGMIEGASGDFFDELPRRIGDGEIFVTETAGEPVAFGIAVPSTLHDGVASIGMFTVEARRGTGAGTATIAGLIEWCRARRLSPIAGCWYYNHASKRTLERAGLYAPTRLLKVEF